MDYFGQFLHNKAILCAIVAWAIAQLIKIITDIVTERRFDWQLLFSTGGMPSSHSSFVTSMAIYTGFDQGFDSAYFAIAFVVAIVVMYDAAGVRRAAGKQAAALNKLLDTLDFNIDERFKELLGHTPYEVFAGAVLGIAVAAVGFFYL